MESSQNSCHLLHLVNSLGFSQAVQSGATSVCVVTCVANHPPGSLQVMLSVQCRLCLGGLAQPQPSRWDIARQVMEVEEERWRSGGGSNAGTSMSNGRREFTFTTKQSVGFIKTQHSHTTRSRESRGGEAKEKIEQKRAEREREKIGIKKIWGKDVTKPGYLPHTTHTVRVCYI